jgi:hypothetical protein
LQHGHAGPLHEAFGDAGAALIGQFVYAVLITLVVIFATIAVSRAAERANRVGERLEGEQALTLLGCLRE